MPQTKLRGEQHGRAKLTWAQVREIRRRAAQGERALSLAREYNMSKGSIDKIIHQKTWIEPHMPAPAQ